MGKIDTLLDKLCAKPTPANFRYSDLRTVMAHFGYVESNKGATSGSRVKFYHPETKAAIMLHKPHPGDEMVKSSVDSAVIFKGAWSYMKNDNLLHYKGYSAKPEYSVEDKVFYGKILGIDDLVDFYSENAKSIETEFQKAVDDYLTFCAEIGKDPQKEYSGMFNVRIPPELHRKLSMAAQSEGVSLNKVVEQAISSYV